MTFEAQHKLTFEWNRIMQHLSIANQPHHSAVLTRKLFAGDWHNSARLITPLCLLASLLVPGQPSLHARYSGGTHPTFPELLRYTLFELTVDRGDPCWAQLPAEVRGSGALRGTAAEGLLEALWRHAAERRGVYFSFVERVMMIPVGHLAFLMPTMGKGGEKSFLIADPEVSFFKAVTFQQLYDLIKDPQAKFDLLDT